MINKKPPVVKLLPIVVLIMSALIILAGAFFVDTTAIVENSPQAYVQNVSSEQSYDYPLYDTMESQPLLSSAPTTSTTQDVYNITIFIRFQDTTDEIAENAFNSSLEIYSNDAGKTDSIRSYYEQMTYGQVIINNCFAYDDQANTSYFVYTAPKNMYDYQNTDDPKTDGSMTNARKETERELLQGAMLAYDQQYKGSYVDADFDIDDDGYFDSVCFVLLGQSSGDWGSLLWPHKSNLAGIGVNATIEIGGQRLKGGDYTFSFGYVKNYEYNFAVACHEMGHVFGVTDYYSYDNIGNAYSYVGLFDLMGDTSATTAHPSYMTAYTRNKYLKTMGTKSIQTIYKRQDVTLTAVTEATGVDDVVAVKIPTDISGVYLMAEYRINNSSTTYDNSIGGSGVIVYRVNENADGNTKAKSLVDYDNIELFVYGSNQSVKTALLTEGESNSNFTINSSNKLDVTISVTTVSGSKATISIVGSGLRDNTPEPTPNDYFLDKVDVEIAAFVFDTANENFGVKTIIKVTNIDMAKLTNMSISLVDANGITIYTMQATRGALLTYSGSTARFEVFFDYLGAGDEQWFSGKRLTKDEPKAVTVTMTDTDNDVIPIGTIGTNGKKAIDTRNYLWENIVAVADFYGTTQVYFVDPFVEATVGETFSVPQLIVRSPFDDYTCTINLDNSMFRYDGNANVITVLEGVEEGIYKYDIIYKDSVQQISTQLVISVVGAKHTYSTIALEKSVPLELGKGWTDIESTVKIDGVEVNIKDATMLSFDPYTFEETASKSLARSIKFSYNGKYYTTTLEIADRIVAVNFATPTFDLFDGQGIPTDSKLYIYCLSGRYYEGAINGVGIGFTHDDISSFTGSTYKRIAFTVTYNGMSKTGAFNYFRRAIVESSFIESGQSVTVNGTKYYTGSYTLQGVNMGGFAVDFELVDGNGINTYTAYDNSTPYIIRDLPTGEGDYTNVTISIWYDNGNTSVRLGNLTLNFRILKTAVGVTVEAKESGKVSGDGSSVSNAVVFFIDEYTKGLLSFQYVISFSAGEPERVSFILSDKVSIVEGDFSFVSTEWGISVTLYFYGVDVVEDITVEDTSYFGEALPTLYPATTYLGKSLEVTPTITGFDRLATLNGVQSVTFAVVYNALNTTRLPYERTVTVVKSIKLIDGVYELKRATLVTTRFNFGEQASVDYLQMLTYVTYYNYYMGIDGVESADTSKATFSTLNHNKISGTTREAVDTLTITYEGKTLDVEVTLFNGLKEVRLSLLSVTVDGVLYKQQGSSRIDYVVKYENGETETISVAMTAANTTVVDTGLPFVCDDIGEYRVTVKNPNYAGEVLATQNIFVYKKVKSVDGIYDTKGNLLTSMSIKYGDVLQLAGYVVKYTEDGGIRSQITLKRSYYAPLSNQYSLMSGDTIVSIMLPILTTNSLTYNAAEYAVPVKVGVKNNSEILSIQDSYKNKITIDHNRGIVMLLEEMTTTAFYQAVKTDARFNIVLPTTWAYQNAGGYVVENGKKQGYILTITNSDNVKVQSYQVLLKGDANGNAESELEDIGSFAQAVANGSDEYIDCFSNGKFGLADLVKQILERKNTQSPIPLAELFVCEYKVKEDEV